MGENKEASWTGFGFSVLSIEDGIPSRVDQDDCGMVQMGIHSGRSIGSSIGVDEGKEILDRFQQSHMGKKFQFL